MTKRLTQQVVKMIQYLGRKAEVLKDCTRRQSNSLKFKMVTEKTVFEY